jgi:hypothetical protein
MIFSVCLLILMMNNINKMNETNKIFKGEKRCQSTLRSNQTQCENLAYFIDPSNNLFLCGNHSRGMKNRVDLPKNPNKKIIVEQQLKKHQEECDKIAQENKNVGKHGQVMCTKMRMMKNPPDIKGFLKVFPNFKHENRKDGYGCSSLSPKSIGPIHHHQPKLPVAKNLENFHQFNKVFPWEVDEEGKILPIFFETQLNAYNDSTPHRHKIPPKDIQSKKRSLNDTSNINIPLFSVHLNSKGELKQFSYLESRFFYCHHYEQHVKILAQFLHLRHLLKDGYNLQIVGYDAYPLEKIGDTESNVDMFKRFYSDISKPFGHELVLAAMLIIEDPSQYPWNLFFRNNLKLYQDCFRLEDNNQKKLD